MLLGVPPRRGRRRINLPLKGLREIFISPWPVVVPFTNALLQHNFENTVYVTPRHFTQNKEGWIPVGNGSLTFNAQGDSEIAAPCGKWRSGYTFIKSASFATA